MQDRHPAYLGRIGILYYNASVLKRKPQAHLCVVLKQAGFAGLASTAATGSASPLHEMRYHCAVITDKERIDSVVTAKIEQDLTFYLTNTWQKIE